MNITISGKSKVVTKGLSLEELIYNEDVENPEYVTVSINDEFIQRGTFGEVILKEGDVVEFLYFMGGGCF